MYINCEKTISGKQKAENLGAQNRIMNARSILLLSRYVMVLCKTRLFYHDSAGKQTNFQNFQTLELVSLDMEGGR